MKRNNIPTKSAQEGVVIIEAMVAILIFSFAILGIVGLQAAMIKHTAESKYRADASYIAQQKIGLLWANPADLINSPLIAQNQNIDNLLPNGTMDIVLAGPQLTVSINWQAPGDKELHTYSTSTSISEGKVP